MARNERPLLDAARRRYIHADHQTQRVVVVRQAKAFIKSCINALPAPVAIKTWDVIWHLMYRTQREKTRRQRPVFRRLGSPTVVSHGPFKGMKYIHRSTGSAFIPKLIGTYEMELIPTFESICRYEPDMIVDIGSAEGYYAVGLARRLPRARVVCYDIYKPARYLLGQLARLNNVTRQIDVYERCTPPDLQHLLQNDHAERPVLICDCEGAEDVLLLPDQTPDLARCVIVVELHEGLCAGVTERVRTRFQPTHDLTLVKGEQRMASMLPAEYKLSTQDALEAVDEYRYGPMDWFVMKPKGMRW